MNRIGATTLLAFLLASAASAQWEVRTQGSDFTGVFHPIAMSASSPVMSGAWYATEGRIIVRCDGKTVNARLWFDSIVFGSDYFETKRSTSRAIGAVASIVALKSLL